MSIFSQLIHGKISFSQAATQVEQWFAKEIGSLDPAVSAAANAAVSDLKQAASIAVGLGDTALGGLLGTATGVVEGAVNTAIATALGPAAPQLTPAVDAAISHISDTLKAAIDAEAARLRAGLATPAVTMAPVANPAAS